MSIRILSYSQPTIAELTISGYRPAQYRLRHLHSNHHLNIPLSQSISSPSPGYCSIRLRYCSHRYAAQLLHYNIPLLPANTLYLHHISSTPNSQIPPHHAHYPTPNLPLVSKLSFPSTNQILHTNTPTPVSSTSSSNTKQLQRRRNDPHPSTSHLHLTPKLSIPRSYTSLYTSKFILFVVLSSTLSKSL